MWVSQEARSELILDQWHPARVRVSLGHGSDPTGTSKVSKDFHYTSKQPNDCMHLKYLESKPPIGSFAI